MIHGYCTFVQCHIAKNFSIPECVLGDSAIKSAIALCYKASPGKYCASEVLHGPSRRILCQVVFYDRGCIMPSETVLPLLCGGITWPEPSNMLPKCTLWLR